MGQREYVLGHMIFFLHGLIVIFMEYIIGGIPIFRGWIPGGLGGWKPPSNIEGGFHIKNPPSILVRKYFNSKTCNFYPEICLSYSKTCCFYSKKALFPRKGTFLLQVYNFSGKNTFFFSKKPLFNDFFLQKTPPQSKSGFSLCPYLIYDRHI